MRRYLTALPLKALPVCALLLIAPAPAHADIFQVWGHGLVGGAYGNGTTNKDFFRWAGGGAVGAEVGAKLLFISAYLDYLRFFGGSAGANLASLNLGGDGEIGLAGDLKLVLRLAGTVYVGSLETSDTAAGGVQTRGIGLRGGVGLRYVFLKIFALGITPQLGYHYFFGGAEDDVLKDNSKGWDFQAMGYARIALGF